MRSERRRIGLTLIFAGFFTVLAFVSVGCATNTYTVCPSGGCNYTSIQDAIDAAQLGDTIEVHSGTYYENVNVSQQLILRGNDTGGGKPVVDASGSGTAITLNANGVTVDGFTAINASSWSMAGILVYSNNNIVINNTANSNNWYGIFLSSSSNNTIANNTMVGDGIIIEGYQLQHWNTHSIDTSNTVNGKPVYYWKNQVGGTVPLGAGQIILANCTNVVVENQNVNNGSAGISLGFSSGNTIANNTANSNNWYGIFLSSSSNNTIANNTASNNSYVGIYLRGGNRNTISESEATGNAFTGIDLQGSTHNNVTNNTANSNGYYGIVLWSSSNNNTIKTNTASDNERGITLGYSNDNVITNNTLRDNSLYGLEMQQPSNNNTVSNNTIDNNKQYGIYIGLYDAYYSWNRIIRNTITNNNYGLYAVNATNTTIEGNIITKNSYGGIHLSEYSTNNSINGNVVCENGISDFYLEGSPVGNTGDENTCGVSDGWADDGTTGCTYICAVNLAFDTGPGTYPSIAGTFNGTIRPNETITVHTLYTYPCAGTGGHTEYAAIAYSNGTLLAEAHWNGYSSDWHNLTFSNSFTLYANETYNYTIHTGSYPQIIHEPAWNITGGHITCSEFVDANGKRHEGWIPAIRLEGTQTPDGGGGGGGGGGA
jgi:parallel beta-helix repeat protein